MASRAGGGGVGGSVVGGISSAEGDARERTPRRMLQRQTRIEKEEQPLNGESSACRRFLKDLPLGNSPTPDATRGSFHGHELRREGGGADGIRNVVSSSRPRPPTDASHLYPGYRHPSSTAPSARDCSPSSHSAISAASGDLSFNGFNEPSPISPCFATVDSNVSQQQGIRFLRTLRDSQAPSPGHAVDNDAILDNGRVRSGRQQQRHNAKLQPQQQGSGDYESTKRETKEKYSVHNNSDAVNNNSNCNGMQVQSTLSAPFGLCAYSPMVSTPPSPVMLMPNSESVNRIGGVRQGYSSGGSIRGCGGASVGSTCSRLEDLSRLSSSGFSLNLLSNSTSPVGEANLLIDSGLSSEGSSSSHLQRHGHRAANSASTALPRAQQAKRGDGAKSEHSGASKAETKRTNKNESSSKRRSMAPRQDSATSTGSHDLDPEEDSTPTVKTVARRCASSSGYGSTSSKERVESQSPRSAGVAGAKPKVSSRDGEAAKNFTKSRTLCSPPSRERRKSSSVAREKRPKSSGPTGHVEISLEPAVQACGRPPLQRGRSTESHSTTPGSAACCGARSMESTATHRRPSLRRGASTESSSSDGKSNRKVVISETQLKGPTPAPIGMGGAAPIATVEKLDDSFTIKPEMWPPAPPRQKRYPSEVAEIDDLIVVEKEDDGEGDSVRRALPRRCSEEDNFGDDEEDQDDAFPDEEDDADDEDDDEDPVVDDEQEILDDINDERFSDDNDADDAGDDEDDDDDGSTDDVTLGTAVGVASSLGGGASISSLHHHRLHRVSTKINGVKSKDSGKEKRPGKSGVAAFLGRTSASQFSKNKSSSLSKLFCDQFSSVSISQPRAGSASVLERYGCRVDSQNSPLDILTGPQRPHSAATEPVTLPALTKSLFPKVPPTITFCGPNEKVEPFPPEIAKLLKWRMSPITPNIVKHTIARSGFRATKKSHDWLGYWGKHMRATGFRTVKDYQKVNHFPGSFQIGRKDRLWKNMLHMQQKFSKKEFNFLPLTYILPQELKQLKRDWDEGKGKMKWIVKPPAAARGSGIKVIHKWSQIPKKKSVIVQRYIARPFLINESKFDIRLYVYVTSFDPLRVYLFDDGLARFASAKYSSAVKFLSNKYIHLTNYSINKKNVAYRDNESEDSCSGHKWSLKALWGYMRRQGIDVAHIWEDIKDVVIKSIICVGCDHVFCEANINSLIKANVKRRFCCHELFGFDILLDEKLKVWLLEVNISPSLHSSSGLDVGVKGQLVKDVLNMAGFAIPDKNDVASGSTSRKVRKFNVPEQTRGAAFPQNLIMDKRLQPTTLSPDEKAKHAFYTQLRNQHESVRSSILETLTPDDLRVLVEMEDEHHRRGNFRRLLPLPGTNGRGGDKYLKFMEKSRYYNILCHEWTTKYHKTHSKAGLVGVAKQQEKTLIAEFVKQRQNYARAFLRPVPCPAPAKSKRGRQIDSFRLQYRMCVFLEKGPPQDGSLRPTPTTLPEIRRSPDKSFERRSKMVKMSEMEDPANEVEAKRAKVDPSENEEEVMGEFDVAAETEPVVDYRHEKINLGIALLQNFCQKGIHLQNPAEDQDHLWLPTFAGFSAEATPTSHSNGVVTSPAKERSKTGFTAASLPKLLSSCHRGTASSDSSSSPSSFSNVSTASSASTPSRDSVAPLPPHAPTAFASASSGATADAPRRSRRDASFDGAAERCRSVSPPPPPVHQSCHASAAIDVSDDGRLTAVAAHPANAPVCS